MMRSIGFTMLLGLGLAVSACDKDKAGTTTTTETKSESKTVSNGKTTETKTQTKVTEVSPSGSVGVAECDDYLKKMADCAAKAPAGAADPMRKSVEAARHSWTVAAATPAGKSALASGCNQALESARSAYAGLGCNL
jgi:leucyl aminopeptidase (aminopeptidase T)